MESGIQNNNSHRNHETKDDKEFAFLLNRLRTHERGQPFFLERFLERFIYTSSVSISHTPEEAKYVLHIFRTNKEVNEHNEHMIKQVCELISQEQQISTKMLSMEKSHKEMNHTQLLHQKIYWTYMNLESVPELC